MSRSSFETEATSHKKFVDDGGRFGIMGVMCIYRLELSLLPCKYLAFAIGLTKYGITRNMIPSLKSVFGYFHKCASRLWIIMSVHQGVFDEEIDPCIYQLVGIVNLMYVMHQ